MRYPVEMDTQTDTLNETLHTGNARARIITSAAELITDGGLDATTTRAVAAAAGVQVPTIYRLFGDKNGLLDAVAEHTLAEYVASKAKRKPHPDPVQNLREGWDMHVAFGLAHPSVFAIMNADPQRRRQSPAVKAGHVVLKQRIRAIARAGRLLASEERAMALLESACVGTVLTLLCNPDRERDLELSTVAREAVMAAIISDVSTTGLSGAAGAAITLRSSLDDTTVLTEGERHLLTELLDRIANEGDCG